jgi:predicted P-loop ATPase
MSKRNRSCIWHCGRETKNISRICDSCWTNREAIYQARKARETRELNPKRQAAARKAVEARRKKQAEFNADLPTSELLH